MLFLINVNVGKKHLEVYKGEKGDLDIDNYVLMESPCEIKVKFHCHF